MGLGKDPGSGVPQVGGDVVRVGVGPPLGVCPVDEDGSATGAAASLDVPPAVADHEAGGQVDSVRLGGLKQKARVRLTAGAVVAVLIADENRGDR